MEHLRVGFIGCGRPWKTEGATGFGISHDHARGYRSVPATKIHALADIDLENAEAFRREHGGEVVYRDYREMLAKERLDIVSICTWPHLHAEMAIACAEAGVRAVYCEKPMAPTWAEAKAMVAACEKSGTVLTFSHQRRFDPPYRKAREMIRSGRIGELLRMEMPTSNLYDWGTHWFDMMHFYNGESPAEWVLAAVEPTGGPTIFGVQMEGQGLAQIKFANGVFGFMATGKETGYNVQNRLVGTEGVIEIGGTGWDHLRVWSKGYSDWEDFGAIEPTHPGRGFGLAIENLVECLETGAEPELSAAKALRATELIFACYESARNRGRVDLPLQVADSTVYAKQRRTRSDSGTG
ncbi:MAG: Gfo/Idh/MocA family oxidoreductase [Fimbriimonadaceae bacterium]